MALRDLAEFFDPTLVLPIAGKQYVVPSPDAMVGVHIQRLFNTATAAFAGAELTSDDIASLDLDDAEEQELYPRVLGTAYEEMVADDLPWTWIRHAGSTAVVWVGMGREAAEKFWVEAPLGYGQGEAPRPEPQDHKAPAKKTTRKKAGSRKPATRSTPPAVSPATSSLNRQSGTPSAS